MNKYIIRRIASLLIIATLYTGIVVPTNWKTEPIKLARGGFRGGFGHGGFGRSGFRHRRGFRQQRWHHRRPGNGRRYHRHPRNNRYYYGGNIYGVAVDNDNYWPYGAAVDTAAAYTASQQQQENESLRQHISNLQSQIEELKQSKESENDDDDNND